MLNLSFVSGCYMYISSIAVIDGITQLIIIHCICYLEECGTVHNYDSTLMYNGTTFGHILTNFPGYTICHPCSTNIKYQAL